MDALVTAIESGNALLLLLIGGFGAVWLLDKLAFYVSKYRNKIPLAHARTGTLDTILRRTDENTKMLRTTAIATAALAETIEKFTTKWERDRDDVRSALQSIKETTARLEIRFERD